MSDVENLFEKLIRDGSFVFDSNDFHRDAYINELKMANQHFKNKLFTETGVRLGRATECLIYFIAKKCNHQGRKVVKLLKNWSSDLLGQGRALAEEPDLQQRAKLLDEWINGHQKKINEIMLFAIEPHRIDNEIQTIVFPPQSKKDDVPSISTIWGQCTKKVLSRNEVKLIQNKISAVMEQRNIGAHADPKGHVQEIREELCIEMCHSFADLFQNIQSKFLNFP
jgi:hypothetical protein